MHDIMNSMDGQVEDIMDSIETERVQLPPMAPSSPIVDAFWELRDAQLYHEMMDSMGDSWDWFV